MLISGQSIAANAQASAKATTPATTEIVTLPTVTVRPEASDLAYYQANKIVDLAAITVRPEASDMAAFLADNSARIVDMPVVTVRPTVEDIQIVAVGVVARSIGPGTNALRVAPCSARSSCVPMSCALVMSP